MARLPHPLRTALRRAASCSSSSSGHRACGPARAAARAAVGTAWGRPRRRACCRLVLRSIKTGWTAWPSVWRSCRRSRQTAEQMHERMLPLVGRQHLPAPAGLRCWGAARRRRRRVSGARRARRAAGRAWRRAVRGGAALPAWLWPPSAEPRRAPGAWCSDSEQGLSRGGGGLWTSRCPRSSRRRARRRRGAACSGWPTTFGVIAGALGLVGCRCAAPQPLFHGRPQQACSMAAAARRDACLPPPGHRACPSPSLAWG